MSNAVPKPDPDDWESLIDRVLPADGSAARRWSEPEELFSAPVSEPPARETPTAEPERSRAYVALAMFAAVLALGLGIWATAPRLAMTPDSLQYLSAAQNIAAGRGTVTSVTALETPTAFEPFSAWPPLYPLLLAAGVWQNSHATVSSAPLPWARGINLLAALLTFLPLAFLARWLLGTRWAVGVLLFYATFRPALEAVSFVWSEALFTLLVMGSLALLVRGIELHWRRPGERTNESSKQAGESLSDPSLLYFLAAGCLAGLAGLTRYVGIALVAAGGAAIVMRHEHERPRRVLARLGAFALPAALPLFLWCLRNQFVTGYFFGEARATSTAPPQTILLDTIRTLAHDWFLPPAFASGSLQLGFEVLAGAATVFLIFTLAYRFGPQMMETERQRFSTGIVLVTWVLLYLVLVLGSALRVQTDPINTRLLLPAYPALALVIAVLLRGAADGAPRAVKAGVLASAMLFLVMNMSAGVRYAGAERESQSLTKPYWRSVLWGDPKWSENAETAALGLLPPDALVLTNVWERVSLHTNRPVKPLPGKKERGFPGNVLSHEGAYVLVDPSVRAERIGQPELESIGPLPPGILLLEDFEGGSRLYYVRGSLNEPLQLPLLPGTDPSSHVH